MGFCTDEQARSFLKGLPFVERAMVGSGIILLKYWLEVSMEEQTKRLQDRIDDGRKLWKLSPMDLESYGRWHEYTRARDEMFAATDTDFAPWYVVRSDDKRRARLNCIRHLLDSVPYKDVTRSMRKLKLPKRKGSPGKPSSHPFRHVPEKY
jgi:polyphosphate kinase 2 (PPK2 family)